MCVCVCVECEYDIVCVGVGAYVECEYDIVCGWVSAYVECEYGIVCVCVWNVGMTFVCAECECDVCVCVECKYDVCALSISMYMYTSLAPRPLRGRRVGLESTACACANCSPNSVESAYVRILSVYSTVNCSYSNMRCPCFAD